MEKKKKLNSKKPQKKIYIYFCFKKGKNISSILYILIEHNTAQNEASIA